MTKEIDLQLSELANGAIQEKLNGELEKVFANIHDPNTPATAKRGVTIKLEFKPDDGQVKTDVGVPVDVVEKEMQKNQQVIDLQKKRG